MQLKDARSLPPQAQQAIRKRAVMAVIENKRSQGEVAQEFGVTRTAVNQWVQRYRRGGETALKACKQGRREHPTLARSQVTTITRLIRDYSPEQLQLPFTLWTRQAVSQLIEQCWGITLSQTTIGRYLRRWGLSPQKPAKCAREQCPHQLQHWLTHEYPAIHKRAQQEGAEIHWGDEMGLRSDHQAGTCWSEVGKTPIVEGTGQRFSCNLISALTNRGTLRFQVFQGGFNSDVFLEFLRRLIRSRENKVFLIVDRHPVHRSRKVQQWVAQHQDELELFYLPPYSPERNPDEFLNQDIKSNAMRRQRPRNRNELMKRVRSYLYSLQKCPERISRYFWAQPVQYAGL
ncbi:IS630 family transposase [Euhalothece natronophila Z-M001]|uniref:IS630 family transposase n=1 Tax=Euhalothece natronophila Z-M001 TaxID=522448 RepID=A0A5B8NLV7_9CHRO|nr:IS630 family transposase [Euhalothece natronophila]QDZ39116.1 IS630 family transposase [Euhalothece natronophila Z-M001]QDZ39255.1 IS630 family transposase [Euhalothece natronophila Z-M001]QDZ39328.1 IS630 family transposase [Euhalothece natronophila Z-M001]QDZ39643.1 IS630 family transposase [Euhalothece natronophila Z-M001]QDZ40719.1 IS630 family transposase [Euhalothece natronophila Z-M001]